jgi:hypothetical protein
MYWLIVCVEFGVDVMPNGKYQIALTQATPNAIVARQALAMERLLP